MSTQYNTLVLSGGSIRSICILGALQYCEDNKLLDSIETVVATSAGSIIAYLTILGYSPIDLISILCSHKLFKNQLPVFDVMSLISGEGAISFLPFQDLLEKLTIDKTGMLLTLRQLFDIFGKKLVVSTLNYSKREIEYISYKSHPDMPCLIALRMSTALPLVFPMVSYMGCKYLDAGMIENFPIGYLKQTDTNTLGICIEPYFHEDDTEQHLYNFLHNLLSIPSKIISQYQNPPHSIDVINISIDTHFLNFYMNAREKLDLFSNGYQCAQTFYITPTLSVESEPPLEQVLLVAETKVEPDLDEIVPQEMV